MRKLNVLVVDDENHLRSAVAFEIESLGHDFCEAEDGIAAWNLLEKSTFDLIISDIRMPKMDGLALLEKIQQKYGNKLPFIFMTGFADIPIWEAYGKGAFGFLGKPFRCEDLENLINRIFLFRDKQWHEGPVVTPSQPLSLSVPSLDEINSTKDLCIGEGGIFLKSPMGLYKKGEVLSFDIQETKQKTRLLEGTAVVKWIQPHGQENAYYGIEFIRLSENSTKNMNVILQNDKNICFIPYLP